MGSLICTWINSWVNNREAGDLRCHRTNYDVIVMDIASPLKNICPWTVTTGLFSGCPASTVSKTGDIFIQSIFTPQPSGLEGYCRHGPGGRAGGCQTCGTHISVTAWWIFSIRSSVELSRPVVVHRHGHLSICPKWACPWPKNLSNLVQIGSRLCGTHISETAGWIDPI